MIIHVNLAREQTGPAGQSKNPWTDPRAHRRLLSDLPALHATGYGWTECVMNAA